MKEIYRKWGRAIRYERGRFVRTREAGEAFEEGMFFEARPSGIEAALPEIERGEVERVVREIESLVAPPLTIDRLIVTRGVARHECEGRQWEEETRRLHLAIASPWARAVVDRGDFDLRDLPAIVEALAGARSERPAVRMRLAGSVGAALLPLMAGRDVPGAVIRQVARGVDGKGLPVEECVIVRPPWPNWYRPSYRVRPVRLPLHLRIDPLEGHQSDGPVAVALAAHPEGATLRLLCTGPGGPFIATVTATRIESAKPSARWYPYSGGAFGAELTVSE
ncbi:MAG TPA: hypothetical protein VNL91_02015 [Thermoanaerobaculia bacterium]|nr:hypothetical protein [Thermoanaerobaculia bacterium]